jgi:hypothetical protein
MVDLVPNVGAGTLLERTLLADDRAVRIGAIQSLDYNRAVVITHDRWKADNGGIPQFAFLLATARKPGTGGGDDDEVLLLRVEGTAPLSLERDLLGVREEALRDALSRSDNPSPSVVLDVELEPFTKNRVSFTGRTPSWSRPHSRAPGGRPRRSSAPAGRSARWHGCGVGHGSAGRRTRATGGPARP